MNWTISQHAFRCGASRAPTGWDDSALLESDSKEVASTGDPAGADRA